jgi:hypothetical protein
MRTEKAADAEKAMTEHEIAQKAFSANRERLKAERLAREAAGTLSRGQESQDQEEGALKIHPLSGRSPRQGINRSGLAPKSPMRNTVPGAFH